MKNRSYIVIGILIIFLFISVIANVSLVNMNKDLELMQSEIPSNLSPDIISIEFLGSNNQNVVQDGWATVPADGRLKIKFKLKGDCTSIEMFITPTGSSTYLLQRRVEVIDILPGQEEAEYVWQVPKGTLGHFDIIAYNGMKGTKSELYNVVSE